MNLVLDGLPTLTSNEYLVLAGTLHGIHAITSRLSPTSSSSGAQVIEGETFKMTILLTATGTPDAQSAGEQRLTISQGPSSYYSHPSRRLLWM